MLAGGLCEIFGFGGIGAATARLMHGIGMRVRAIAGGLDRNAGAAE